MAQPTKRGLDYFPFDVDMLNDRKFRKAKNEYGTVAVLVYIILLCMIYKDKGYYLIYDDKTKDDVIWEIQAAMQGKYTPEANAIEQTIETLVEAGLFSKEMKAKGILTSRKIQKTYYKATVDRKCEEIDFDIWILTEKEMCQISERSIILKKYINSEAAQQNYYKTVEQIIITENDKAAPDKLYDKNLKDVIELYQQNIAPIMPMVAQGLKEWINEVDVSLVKYAIKEAVNYNKRTYKYINAILKNCLRNNIKTEADAIINKANRIEDLTKSTKDIEEIEQAFMNTYRL